jgi:hypothetical protein
MFVCKDRYRRTIKNGIRRINNPVGITFKTPLLLDNQAIVAFLFLFCVIFSAAF